MLIPRIAIGWRSIGGLAAALTVLTSLAASPARAQQNEDVFSSSGGGRSCGYPGYSYDMSKVEDAARGYPNSRILILTPEEKRDLEEKLASQDPRSGAPIVQMAPCFNCSQDYEACILFSRDGPIPGGDEFGSNGPPTPGGDEYGSNGGNQPPTSGGDETGIPGGPLGEVLYGACPPDYANMDKPGLTPEMHYALGFSQAARKCMADTVTIENLAIAAAAMKVRQIAAILMVMAAPQVLDGVLHPPGVSPNPDPYLQGREEGKRLCEWGLKVSPVLVARCPAKSAAKPLACTAAQAQNGYGVLAAELQASAPTRTDCFPCSLAWVLGEHYTPPPGGGRFSDLAADIIPLLKRRFGNLIPQGPELPCWRQLAQSEGIPGSMTPTGIEQEMLAAGDGAKGIMLWKGAGNDPGHVVAVRTVGEGANAHVEFWDEQQLMDARLWFPDLQGKWVTFYRVQ